MISALEATRIASSYLDAWSKNLGMPLVLLQDQPAESKYAWVFYYASRRYQESKNLSDMLAGGGPILVDKTDASVHRFGSAFLASQCIDR